MQEERTDTFFWKGYLGEPLHGNGSGPGKGNCDSVYPAHTTKQAIVGSGTKFFSSTPLGCIKRHSVYICELGELKLWTF